MKAVPCFIRAVGYRRAAQVADAEDIKMIERKVYIRMGCMMVLKGVNKGKYASVMKLSRWYCNDGSCMCDDHIYCEKERSNLARKSGCALTYRTLSMLFGVGVSGMGGEILNTSRDTGKNESRREELRARHGDGGSDGDAPIGNSG